MLTAAGLTTKGLVVRFADDREGLVPYRDLALEGVPKRVAIPSTDVVEVHLQGGRVEKVAWDLARRYLDPGERARPRAEAGRGQRALGERVFALRSMSGITQDELARMSGINRVTIARIESGEQLPRYQTLRALAEGLGVPIGRLTVG
jgi:DNA-binding XRE family transcriptional regulator